MRYILPNILGICLFPIGIFFRNEYFTMKSFNHEAIHWRQQKEMLCIFFYVWYVLEWFVKIFFCGKYAYLSISFEQEAYSGVKEHQRKMYGWTKYVFKRYKNETYFD